VAGCILIVEDHAPDLMLIREAIEAAGIEANVQVARDGQQATDFVDAADRDEAAPVPTLIMLDINLPKKHGNEVLAHVRKSIRSRAARVLVLSTSDAAGDRERMKALGADRYFRKPSDYKSFMNLGEVIREMMG
jgi:CheY-like chemotaxis protein